MKIAIAAFVAAGLASPLAAQPSGEEADLACLAAMAAMASNDESEIRQAGIYGIVFFIGKLLGRDPAFALETRLAALDVATVTATLQRDCALEVQTIAGRMARYSGER